MSKELRDEAERLVNALDTPEAAGHLSAKEQWLLKFAEAYLRDLPADDDNEPVTPDMVERLGWCKQKWGRDASCVSFVSPLASDGRTTLRWRPSFGHQGWRIASSGVADSYAITPVTTFGQLAALCRGLGIPCEVK